MAMFKPSELASLLWAFARLHFKSERVFTEAVEAGMLLVSSSVTEIEPLHIAMLAWSYAKLDVKNAPLYSMLFTRAAGVLHDMDPGAQAMLAWAIAKASSAFRELAS